MDARTLTALRASIAHWRRMETGTAEPDEAPFARNCALCQEFYDNEDKDGVGCSGCPVREHTDEPECKYSPYQEAVRLWSRGIPANEQSDDFCLAAKVEREFLESLLPDGEAP